MSENILASLFSKPNNKKSRAVMCDRCLKNNCGCHKDFMRQTSNLKIPFMKSIKRDYSEGVPTMFNERSITNDSYREDEKIFSRIGGRKGSKGSRRTPSRSRRRRVRKKVVKRRTGSRTITRGRRAPAGNITAGSRARTQRLARIARSRRRPVKRTARPINTRETRAASRKRKERQAVARNKVNRAREARVGARGKTVSRTTGRFPRDKTAILEAAKLRGRARADARDTGAIPIDQRQLDTRLRLGTATGQEVVGTIPEQIAGIRQFTSGNLPASQGGFPISVVVTNAPSGSGGSSAGSGQGRLSFEDAYPKQTGQLIALGRSTVDRSNEIQALSKFVNERAKFTNERAEFVNKKLVDIDEKLTNLGSASTDASEAIGFNKILGSLGSTGLLIAGGIVLMLVLRR